VEARVRAMPRDVATLARGQAVSLEDARRLTAARPGAAGVLSGGPPRPGPAGAPGEMMRAPTMLREVDASTPRLASVGARVNGTERWVVLTGHFPGSSPIAVVYVRPLDGQSLAEAGQQTVDGQPVNVVLARVNATRSRIEGALPVGLAPGRYRVSARIPQGQREPVTNGRTLELAAYAYSLRITRIRCVDESDPEAIREQISGYEVGALTDEIRFSWATFADGGLTDMGMSQQYEGFDDYTHKPVRVHPSDDGALFMRVDGQPTPGVVANRLFAVLQMWEVDDAGFEVMRDGRFPAELGLASLDDVDVDQFLERLSQSLYWSMAAFEGSHERIGERRLSWSAGELQQMTDNPGRRHEGEIRFENDDATGTYLLHYEIRRVDAPR
ncbi:MAG TPA: hypothetical protein VK420_15785, partial [Longimicrobium sp.]|nr:hypothetical protein [Longimicrobium sp.]